MRSQKVSSAAIWLAVLWANVAHAQQAPSITSAASASFTAGAVASFQVTTSASPVPAITETGALPQGVTFIDNSDGTATLAGTTTSVGTYSIVITASNGLSPDAVQTFTLTVNKFVTTTTLSSSLNPATYGQAVTYTATVNAAGGASPTGSVTFNFGATQQKVQLSGGSAAVSYSLLNSGARTVKATYGGNLKNAGSSSSMVETIQSAPTSTVITNAVPSPSGYGNPVTFTASVASTSGVPTGNVTFMNGTKTLGTVGLSAGIATFTTTATQLPTGTDTISAKYAGAVNFSRSVSGSFSQTVGQASTTTGITFSANPASTGQSVMLTATVSSAAGTPPGSVQFVNGTSPIGTATLNGGSAQLSTLFAAPGSYILGANFLGSTNYASSSGSDTEVVQPGQTPSSPIQHVVVIFQENRTPDNLFQGLPGADIATTGINSKGQVITLTQTSMVQSWDLSHSHKAFVLMYDNGLIDGADKIGVGCTKTTTGCPPNPQFQYVNPNEVAEYFQLAEQYTFGDRMFQSNQGPSYPAHQYIIAGTSAPSVGGPYQGYLVAENPIPGGGATGCVNAPSNQTVALIDALGSEAISIYPCFEHPTLIDLLDSAAVSWRYYSPGLIGIWVAPNSIQHLRTGSDWNNVITPQSQILTDIANGNLAQVSWVMPNAPESDHASATDGSGPSWVASIVNAIGASPYWNNTAIIITWDDWGGWYDHVPPPVSNSYEHGFRVPLIVVSPYARRGYVSHVTHDFGSILHFIETTFNLSSLGYQDSLSDDLSDCFDFTQQASSGLSHGGNPFKAISSLHDASYFIERGKTAPVVPPDDD